MALTDVDIGAMQVYFNGVDLGQTLEGVNFTVDRTLTDIKTDQYGTINKAISAQKVTATFKLVELINTNLRVAIPEGEYQSGASGSRVGLGSDLGRLLGTSAGTLRLRPLKNVSSGVDTNDIVLYKAISTDPVEQSYKVDEQRVFEITMEGLADSVQISGRRIGHVGPTNIS